MAGLRRIVIGHPVVSSRRGSRVQSPLTLISHRSPDSRIVFQYKITNGSLYSRVSPTTQPWQEGGSTARSSPTHNFVFERIETSFKCLFPSGTEIGDARSPKSGPIRVPGRDFRGSGASRARGPSSRRVVALRVTIMAQPFPSLTRRLKKGGDARARRTSALADSADRAGAVLQRSGDSARDGRGVDGLPRHRPVAERTGRRLGDSAGR